MKNSLDVSKFSYLFMATPESWTQEEYILLLYVRKNFWARNVDKIFSSIWKKTSYSKSATYPEMLVQAQYRLHQKFAIETRGSSYMEKVCSRRS